MTPKTFKDLNTKVKRTSFFNRTEYTNILGQYHRIDGPAIEYANGDGSWYQNGKLHRLDGPALDWDDDKEYYINGNSLSEEEFNLYKFVNKL